jgi:hypothetical protein
VDYLCFFGEPRESGGGRSRRVQREAVHEAGEVRVEEEVCGMECRHTTFLHACMCVCVCVCVYVCVCVCTCLLTLSFSFSPSVHTPPPPLPVRAVARTCRLEKPLTHNMS